MDKYQVPRIFIRVAVRWWLMLGLLNGGLLVFLNLGPGWPFIIVSVVFHVLIGSFQGLLLFLGQNQELDRSPAIVVRTRGSIISAFTGVAWGAIAVGASWSAWTRDFWGDSHMTPVELGAITGFLLGIFLNRLIWSAVDTELNG